MGDYPTPMKLSERFRKSQSFIHHVDLLSVMIRLLLGITLPLVPYNAYKLGYDTPWHYLSYQIAQPARRKMSFDCLWLGCHFWPKPGFAGNSKAKHDCLETPRLLRWKQGRARTEPEVNLLIVIAEVTCFHAKPPLVQILTDLRFKGVISCWHFHVQTIALASFASNNRRYTKLTGVERKIDCWLKRSF